MLAIDGDILVYRIAWACKNEVLARAFTSLNHMIGDILCTAGDECEDYQIYLSGSSADNFRHKVAYTLPYKGNRKNAERPSHYGDIREYIMNEYKGVMTTDEEADDVIIQVAYQLGDDATMVSVDKDFLQMYGWHYNPVKKVKQYQTPDDGLRFLYEQALTGDTTDNIAGIKGVGPVKAARALEWCTTEEEMYDICLGMYNGDARRLQETFRLIYLRRIPNEWWVPPHARTFDSATGNPTGSYESLGEHQ